MEALAILPEADARAPRSLTVTELAQLLRDTLRGNPILSRVLVRGEASNVQRTPAGHVFFTLKDATAQVACVLFRDEAEAAAPVLEDGMEVVASGEVDLYTRKGEVQLVVRAVTPAGIGAFWATFQRTRKRLAADGLFDVSRKRPLPRFPRRIGVVTSESGAVVHDIVVVLRRRWPLADVVVAPSSVQGSEAPAQLRSALRALGDRVDVVVLARGGGSLEDLWAFNDEALARSIAACPVAVVSAVGHETDVTIADFVADVRAPTPSAAAEVATPDAAELRARLRTHRDALARSVLAVLRERWTDVARIGERLSPAGLRREVETDSARLSTAASALLAAGTHSVERARERLESLGRRLDVLSPLATLRRGYAIVSRPDGGILPCAKTIEAGEPLVVRLQDGRVHVHVDRKEVP